MILVRCYSRGSRTIPLDELPSPADWRRREHTTLALPELPDGFHTPMAASGRFSGNSVYEVEPRADGWPSVVWASHRAPKGGPLTFGTIGTARGTRAERRRTLDISPHLRLSAYAVIEAPPPPTGEDTPTRTTPAEPPAAPGDDTPARDPR